MKIMLTQIAAEQIAIACVGRRCLRDMSPPEWEQAGDDLGQTPGRFSPAEQWSDGHSHGDGCGDGDGGMADDFTESIMAGNRWGIY